MKPPIRTPPGQKRRENRDPLPPGLVSRTFGLPIQCFATWFICAWPTIALIAALDWWEPGRTWRVFGAGPVIFRLYDAAFLLALCPLVGAWVVAAPKLFDGRRARTNFTSPFKSLGRTRFVILYACLAGLYLAGMTLISAGLPNATTLLRFFAQEAGTALPIGATAWGADFLRILLLAGILFGAARFYSLLVGETRRSRITIGIPRAFMLAAALGVLQYIFADTIIPLLAESVVSIDLGLAQGLYRVLGGYLDIYLVSAGIGYIAVISSIGSRAAESD